MIYIEPLFGLLSLIIGNVFWSYWSLFLFHIWARCFPRILIHHILGFLLTRRYFLLCLSLKVLRKTNFINIILINIEDNVLLIYNYLEISTVIVWITNKLLTYKRFIALIDSKSCLIWRKDRGGSGNSLILLIVFCKLQGKQELW